MKKNMIWSIAGTLLGVAGLVQYFIGMSSADAYNEYAAQISVLIDQQDAILEEIKEATDAEGATKVDDWLKRAQQVESGLKAVSPEEDWLVELHQHMLQRAHSFTRMTQSAQAFYATGDESLLEEMEKHATAGADHLDNFVAARDQAATDHDFELED